MVKFNYKGFTIIELMATLTITTSIFLGLTYIFIQSSEFYKRQFIFQDVHNYANNSLDIILDDIKTATNTALSQDNGYCQIITNTVDDDDNPIINTYFVDQEMGIMLNDMDEPILNFYNGADQNYSLTIESFECNIINDSGISPDLSSSIFDFNLTLLYHYNLKVENAIKLLSYSRRLFSSTDFIIAKQN